MENQTITIEQLYPNLSAAEQRSAAENIQAYLGLVLRIYQRLEYEGNLEVLTETKTLPTFMAKVDSKQP